MRADLTVLAAAGLMAVLVGALAIGNRTKKGEIQSPPREHLDIFIPTPVDLGRIWVGEEASGVVPILNRSRDAVDLAISSTSCGCTDAVIDTERLEPRERATLLVTVNTAKKNRHFVESIKLEARIRDLESVPHTHLYQIDVRGDIDQRRGLFPPQLDFGRVRRASGSVTRQFRLVADPESTVDVDRVRRDLGVACLDLQMSQIPEDGFGVWHGTVILDPDAATPDATGLDKQIAIPVESSGVVHELRLRVAASLGFPVEHTPNMLYWSASNRDSTQYLQFNAVGDASITIVDIRCPDAPFVSFTVKQNRSPHPVVEATCTLGDDDTMVRTEMQVTVEYGLGESQLITIPILVM